MSAKHTPAPWSITENKKRTHNGSWFEIDGKMTRVADVPASTNPMWDFVPGYQQGIANARLIGAAPELLSFAKEWLDRQGSDENYMTAKARAVIAKAIG